MQATSGRSDLRRLCVDAAEVDSLVVRELVHRALRNIERADAGVVDREHVDALAVVRQLPARPARRRVPAADHARTANVREPGKRAEGRVACVGE